MHTALETALDVLASFEEAGNIDGESDAPTGWFARLDVDVADLPEDLEYLTNQALQDLIDPVLAEPNQLLGNWLVVNDDQGFITVTKYPSSQDRDVVYDNMHEQYTLWLEAGND